MSANVVLFSLCLVALASATFYYPKPKPVYYKPKPPVYKPKPTPKPGCKKISYQYYLKCIYKFGVYNEYINPYTPKCRKYDEYEAMEKCPKKTYASYGSGYPFRYTGCQTDTCAGYVYEAQGKCHKKITLPKGYYYKGAQCRDENSPCGYKSWYGHYPDKCTCQTNICHKSIMACYKMGYYFYQGIVELQYPCGCQCNEPYAANG